MITEEFKARFFAKVNKDADSGCWLWAASVAGKGYGQIKIPGTRKQEYAHRLSWMIHNGPIPEGKSLLHKCDTPRCVNPEHLFLGNHQDNAQDMKSKKRHLFGERNKQHKLTDDDVKKMFAMAELGLSQAKIAKVFDVVQSTVGRILHKQRWVHLHEDASPT